MAQRTIHLLLGKLLSEQVPLKNPNRFFVGSLLPDAINSLSLRNTSHFITPIEKERVWYFDLEQFKEQFGSLINWEL